MTFKNNIGGLGSAIHQDGSLFLSDNVQIENTIYLDTAHTIGILQGSLGTNASMDTLEVADPYSGRIIAQYYNFRPTPLVDTIASAGTEISKYGFLNNAPYKLYNGANPYIVPALKNVNIEGNYPDSYEITMSDSVATMSYSLYAAIPSGATSVSITSNGRDASLLSGKSFTVDTSDVLYRYTQALPGNVYNLTFNDTDATVVTVTTQASPSYALLQSEDDYETATNEGLYNYEFIYPFEIFFEEQIKLNNVRDRKSVV